MARWVRRRDRTGRVLVIANQTPGARDRYGITGEEADRAAWTVDSDGRRLEGAAAINRVLRELGGVGGMLASLYGWRAAAAALEEGFYRWFAKRRSRFHRFGVAPECDEPSTSCK